jgi:hypothetical protein
LCGSFWLKGFLEVELKTKLGLGVVKKNIHKRKPWHYYKGSPPPPPFFIFISFILFYFQKQQHIKLG